MSARISEIERAALHIVECGAQATSREHLSGEVFTVFQRLLGFDAGCVFSIDGRNLAAVNKEQARVRRFERRGGSYLRELSAFEVASRLAGDVLLDTETYTARQRDRLPFYVQYARPFGISSMIGFFLRQRGKIREIVNFTRHGHSHFTARDLEGLHRLVPALALSYGPWRMSLPAAPLTPRESEIVGYLSRGLQNAEIASVLGTSPNTVRNQLASLFRKLGVSTRAELVGLALDL